MVLGATSTLRVLVVIASVASGSPLDTNCHCATNLFRSFRAAAALQRQLESMTAITTSDKIAGRPIFRLGELVQHRKHAYCGTAIGWLAGCPEGKDWRESAGYGGMLSTESDIWYYVLVNTVSGEPKESGLVPVALVPERCLTRPSHSGEFSRTGTSAQSAAVLEALFLGFDDDGQLVPCQQLKDRFDRSTEQTPWSGVFGGCVYIEQQGSVSSASS